MSEHLTHKLHADGSGEVLCDTGSPLRTTHGDDVTCPECRRLMKPKARLTVGEHAIRALAELRKRIEDMAREYEGQAGDTPKGIHPREVARDLRRLLEN
jgi:hypothetical protein